MSTANEITRLGNAKSAIAAAIKEKGVTVPSGTKLDGMAALIGQIETGSSLETWHGTLKVNEDSSVYYTDGNGEGIHKSFYDFFTGEGGSTTEIDAAANTYIVMEGPRDNYPTCVNCELVQFYDFPAIGAYALLIKLTGDNFRVIGS
jgi:hypothetical protein